MVSRKDIARVSVAAIVVAAAGIFFLRSDASRVRAVFRRLSRTVAKSPGETVLSTAARAQRLTALCAETCNLNTPIFPLQGTMRRAELVAAAVQLRSTFGSLSLDFRVARVDIPSRNVARVRATAILTGDTGGHGDVNEVRELLCTLERVDGSWVFTECTVQGIPR